MELTNSDRLQEIRERAEAATPGPWTAPSWEVDDEPILMPLVMPAWKPHMKTEDGEEYECEGCDECLDSEGRSADPHFVASAREDIPWLLQLVTEQQREIDRYRRALEAVNEFAKEDDICTHKTIGAQHGWGACFVCLIQATAQGALRGESGFFGEDDEPEAKGYRKQERPM